MFEAISDPYDIRHPNCPYPARSKGGRAEERKTGSIMHDFTLLHIQHTSHQSLRAFKNSFYFVIFAIRKMLNMELFIYLCCEKTSPKILSVIYVENGKNK